MRSIHIYKPRPHDIIGYDEVLLQETTTFFNRIRLIGQLNVFGVVDYAYISIDGDFIEDNDTLNGRYVGVYTIEDAYMEHEAILIAKETDMAILN